MYKFLFRFTSLNSALTINDSNRFMDNTTHINAIKYGQVVTVNFDGTSSITANADTTICTLPTKFRPSSTNIDFIEALQNYRVYIDTNGNIKCKSNLSAMALRGYVTYVTENT